MFSCQVFSFSTVVGLSVLDIDYSIDGLMSDYTLLALVGIRLSFDSFNMHSSHALLIFKNVGNWVRNMHLVFHFHSSAYGRKLVCIILCCINSYEVDVL